MSCGVERPDMQYDLSQTYRLYQSAAGAYLRREVYTGIMDPRESPWLGCSYWAVKLY